ncbi:MAG TPA: BREX-1 system adenine-specific DNA-methyltransferase PglX, partial [Blastocatellia bacterium]|nr:BREX-1 system adenine-specific DNA-methyltransferase PglX [Blastocatellia bacterium]
LGTLFDGPVMQLLRQFEQATTFGSLIQPILGEADIAELRRAIADKDPGSNLFLSETHGKVLRVLEQAEMLTQRYQVVVANPPYMGSGGMNPNLLEFVRRTFANASTDLYSVFTIRNLSLVKAQGLVGMITIPNWMFLASFEDFRRFLLQHVRVESLVHNGRGVWGSDFGSCSFILSNCPANNQAGSYRKLFNRQGEVQSNDEIESNFFNLEKFPLYKRVKTDFEKIPGWPLGFWLNSTEYEAFKDGVSLTEMSTPVVGLQTGDNERFIRNWNEVSFRKIGFGFRTSQEALLSKAKWFPYTKGGTFRKWYGNNSFIIDWENDGYVIRNHPSSRPQNRNYYFRSGLAYTNVSSASFAARFTDSGFIFDQKGSMFFSANNNHSVFTLGLLHTKIVTRLLTVLCPTVDFNPGSLAKIPVISFATIGHKVQSIITELINLARIDWDNFETSWDFRKLPLLRPELKAETLAASWQNWQAHCDAAIRRMQELERENNRLFIEAYGLQDELTPEVPEDQITLARADARKDVAAFLSYAVGCMMGRYALDQPGLILANAGDTLEHFRLRMAESGLRMEALRFLPDEDGIIPVLDGEWFEDDIVARTREFLRVTFGEATLRDNLRWLEEALGKDLRKYFLVDFYKNHLSNERAYGYKKRPIYWLVQSPQKGFSALIYLHRYTRDTLNLVLNRYLRPYQDKLRARLSDLTRVQASTEASTADKTKARKEADKLTKVLRECEEWERQTLLPLAQQRIELDLDDGVKVNYQKLGEALAPIPGLAAKEED